MRILLVIAVVVVLGMVGIVVHHESTRTRGPAPTLGDAGPRVATISHGEVVDIDAQLVEGQWTVVEFGAEW